MDIKFIERECEEYNSKTIHSNIKCNKCNNKGYIAYPRYSEFFDDYELGFKECDVCANLRKIARLGQDTGLGNYINKTFNDYKIEEKWQEYIYNVAKKYLEKGSDENCWFTILGQSGSGKTLIASIITNELLQKRKRSVICIVWTDFIGALKRYMIDESIKDASSMLDSVKNVDILMIDELMKKYNETDLKYIIEIINYRYNNNLITIITSEKVVDELISIDQATFGRVIEKSTKDYLINIKQDIKKNKRLEFIDL